MKKLKSEQQLFINNQCANVVSIRKKGNETVSLTSVLCKVMESTLRDEVLNY